MRTYRLIWMVLCGLLGLLGASVALTWSVPFLLVVFGCGAGLGVAMTAKIRRMRGHPAVSPAGLGALVGTNAVVGGSATVAFIGLSALLSAWILPVLSLVVGSSPYALRTCHRYVRQHSSWSATAQQQTEAFHEYSREVEVEALVKCSSDPRTMSNAELCRAWRASFRALETTTSVPHRLLIIEARRKYLDEFERRNPHGLEAWLVSGARAAGNPARFMSDNGATGAGIDWDALLHGPDG
jgi:hypothetical protein